MPQTKKQEIVYTVMMVCVMVYGMVCYNIALDVGGMQNFIFLAAFSELPIMGVIAFLLDTFLVEALYYSTNSDEAPPRTMVFPSLGPLSSFYTKTRKAGQKPFSPPITTN